MNKLLVNECTADVVTQLAMSAGEFIDLRIYLFIYLFYFILFYFILFIYLFILFFIYLFFFLIDQFRNYYCLYIFFK